MNMSSEISAAFTRIHQHPSDLDTSFSLSDNSECDHINHAARQKRKAKMPFLPSIIAARQVYRHGPTGPSKMAPRSSLCIRY